MLRLALVALVLGTSVARGAPPGETAPQLVSSPEPEEIKNPGVAVMLSFGVTAAGIVTLASSDSDSAAGLGLAALYFGPSVGRWYAGSSGLSGLGLRAVAAGAILFGFASILSSECEFDDERDACSDDESPEPGALLVIGGAGLWLGSSIADIFFARSDAMDYNRRHQLSLSPTRMQGGATGLALTGRF